MGWLHKSWHRSFGGAGEHMSIPEGADVCPLPHLVAVAQSEERPAVAGMVGGSNPLGDPRQ